MNFTKIVTLAALSLSVAFGSAQAQGKKDPRQSNIEQRQAFFKLLGLYYGPLSAMNKGDMPYDAAAANDRRLRTWTLLVQLDQAPLWMSGADRSFAETSLTLPKAFEDAGAIDKGLSGLATAVAALAPVAGDGLESDEGRVRASRRHLQRLPRRLPFQGIRCLARPANIADRADSPTRTAPAAPGVPRLAASRRHAADGCLC